MKKIYLAFNLLVIIFVFVFSKAEAQTGTLTVLNQVCDSDGIVAVNVTSGLTPPLTYQYSSYSQNIIHSNLNSLTDTIYGLTYALNYVYVTDNFGQSLYLQTSMPNPFNVDQPIVTNAVCPSPTGTAQITINGGQSPSSIIWYNNSNPFPGSVVATGNPVSLPTGSYRALVTDVNGCNVFAGDSGSPAAINIGYISSINYSVAITAANCSNGSATVNSITGGVAPYTYLWSNGNTTNSITNLTQGSFTVKVTDSQGCYANQYPYVNQAVNINVYTSVTNATCLNNNGSIISFASGGVPPYTYTNSNGTSGQNISGLTGGQSVGVTVIDANGCAGNAYGNVNTNTPITVNYSQTSSLCTAPTGSATLNISGGTSPYTVSWNSSPVQTSITISNVMSGDYSFVVTDAVGCVRTGIAQIQSLSTISYANATGSTVTCPTNIGSASATITGANGPFTYLWSNGATTQFINAATGLYHCTMTDAVGCSVVRSAYINQVSPLVVGFSTVLASCIYTSDASVQAIATGGTAPYTYSWWSGQNTATISNVLSGHYYVNVTDANGCTNYVNYNNMHVFVGYNAANTSCYCTIKGKVYVDANLNCVYDAGEQPVNHMMIHCPPFGYKFTNANGDYSFKVPTGTYTLSENIQAFYPLASCQSNAVVKTVVASSGCVDSVNFANVINPIHSLKICTWSVNNAVPGNPYIQTMTIENEGTITEQNIQLSYKHDGQLQYVSTSPIALNQSGVDLNWYSVTTGFDTLVPGAGINLITTYNVPTNIPLATMVNFYDTITHIAPMSNWLNDYTPWNNVNSHYVEVVGSFDPNFKEVSPQGMGSQGYITTADTTLDYAIHFQNTGSYYAQNIVLIDTLDSDLDWTTLRPGYSDHQYEASLSEDGILKFTFSNINLPWQNYNDLASCGLVTYSIKQKPNLALGTEIENGAGIYFDYNAPVLTNKTLNTISAPSKIKEVIERNGISIYPNPANSELYVSFNGVENINTISIYSIAGQLLQKEKVNTKSIQRIGISELACGIYFISVEKNSGERITKKFVKN